MSTSIATREHLSVVEMEDEDYGYRYWSKPMPDSEAKAYIERANSLGEVLSDYCCSTQCWCGGKMIFIDGKSYWIDDEGSQTPVKNSE